MQSERYKDIYQAMMLKTDEELLEIWKVNDHVSWHDELFTIVGEILHTRLVDLPEQDQPILNEEQRMVKLKKKFCL